MAQLLSVEAIIERAHVDTGIDSFDADTYREGLEVVVRDFNRGIAQGRFTADGIELARTQFTGYLSTRLRIADYLRNRPELLLRPIKRPVFVMGVPRTGTTLLSNLLAADPARRSPLTWEINDPVPPATSATLFTDPRALAGLQAEQARLSANPSSGKYYRRSAIYPNECIYFMSHDFKSFMIEAMAALPEYREFLLSADMTSTYEYHRRFLQVLQADAPGVWNLKMPSHAMFLDYLVTAYPDARLVWTHRDPFTATGSLCSLNGTSHARYVENIDRGWLGENYGWQAPEHANRMMDFRDRHGEDRMIDVHYADLLKEPIETVRNLYEQLGDEFTPAAEAGVKGWVDDNPQDKFGKHEYNLAQFGLSVEKLAPNFQRYLERYDVAREG